MLKTTFQLHEYQRAFVANIRTAVVEHKRTIGCAATGAGKSKVFCTIAVRAIERGKTVLIISESRRIFAQVSAEIEATEISAGCSMLHIAERALYLAMAQTLGKRAHLLLQFKAFGDRLLIINDECHIGTATKILFQLPDALLIGFSATPSAREAPHLPRIYKHCVVGPQPHDLVLLGFLAPYKHFARHRADLSVLKTQAGEFTEDSQEKAFQTRKVYDGVMEDLRTIAHRKCLIFTASIAHCDKLTAELKANGFYCVAVHSGLDEATEAYNLAQFMQGLIPICVSVGVLTKGFDFPEIDLIVLQRATTSLPLYCQMIGRGSRRFPGKLYFTVLDYGDNYRRHNLWDYEHDWGKLWNTIKKPKKLGAAPVKNCPKCEYICAASALKCPNCGHVFQKTAQEIKQSKEETILLEITRQYNQQMVGRKLSELSPRELALYARFKNKKAWAARIARSGEQHTPGFLQEFAEACGYRDGWLNYQLDMVANAKELIEFQDIILR